VSGDTINLTVTEAVETINLTLEEEASISINFLEVATVDPRVAQTLLDAQAAQAAAEAAAALASTYAGSSILNALIFG
jgi:hypothetical protein